jgi:hypothetical protein
MPEPLIAPPVALQPLHHSPILPELLAVGPRLRAVPAELLDVRPESLLVSLPLRAKLLHFLPILLLVGARSRRRFIWILGEETCRARSCDECSRERRG